VSIFESFSIISFCILQFLFAFQTVFQVTIDGIVRAIAVAIKVQIIVNLFLKKTEPIFIVDSKVLFSVS